MKQQRLLWIEQSLLLAKQYIYATIIQHENQQQYVSVASHLML